MLDAMDWTNIIMTLITSGAFTAIYLLGDRTSKTHYNGHTNQGNV